MTRYIATFHHRELPAVHWHLYASSVVAAQAEADSLSLLLDGCTHVTVELGPEVQP